LGHHNFLVAQADQVGRDDCGLAAACPHLHHYYVLLLEQVAELLQMSSDGQLLSKIYREEDVERFEEPFDVGCKDASLSVL